MKELQKSVKWKKRKTCNCTDKNEEVKEKEISSEVRKFATCSSIKDLSKIRITLSSVEAFTPSLLTYYAQKTKLNEAYEAAVNVFSIVLSDKSQTTFSEENPWNIRTQVMISDGVSEKEVVIALYIREIEGKGFVGFRYKRIQGDSVSFLRIMEAVENCLLTCSGQLFLDSLDDVSKVVVENKVDE